MAGCWKAEAERWFHQAAYDLRACRWNISGGFNDTAAFLAQQAAEKALKALLYYLGARRKALLSHSLVDMINSLGDRVPALTNLLEAARSLDLHYVPSRYPNGLPGGYPHQFYAKATAESALSAADKIVVAVRDYIHGAGEADWLPPDEA
jgi:HEPN domain-containing protein